MARIIMVAELVDKAAVAQLKLTMPGVALDFALPQAALRHPFCPGGSTGDVALNVAQVRAQRVSDACF